MSGSIDQAHDRPPVLPPSCPMMIETEFSAPRAMRGPRATARKRRPLATTAREHAKHLGGGRRRPLFKNPSFCPDIGQSAAGKPDLRQTAFVFTRLCPVTIASKPPRFAAPGCRLGAAFFLARPRAEGQIDTVQSRKFCQSLVFEMAYCFSFSNISKSGVSTTNRTLPRGFTPFSSMDLAVWPLLPCG